MEAADGWEHRGMPQHCRGEGLNQAGRALLAPPAAVDADSRFIRMKTEVLSQVFLNLYNVSPLSFRA